MAPKKADKPEYAPEIDRVKTGVPGFDELISGGLVRNSLNLLSGGAGTGKTIFALQFLLNGAKLYNERGVYITLEETEAELKADMAALGVSLDDKNIQLKFLPIYEINNFEHFIETEIVNFRPKRVVIDSLTALAMPMEDNFERRKEIYKLKELLKKADCTSLLICEVSSSADSETLSDISKYGIEEFVCDGIVMLHYAGIGGDADRAIRVVKMRRTKHIRGPVPIEIDKLGIKVTRGKFRI